MDLNIDKIKKEISDLRSVAFKVLEDENTNKKKMGVVENSLDSIKSSLPQITSLLLGHLDILLKSGKSFLTMSSSILVASVVLNKDYVINLNVDMLRDISYAGVTLSVLMMIIVLYIRNKEKKKILTQINFIHDLGKDIYLTKISSVDIQLEVEKVLKKLDEIRINSGIGRLE